MTPSPALADLSPAARAALGLAGPAAFYMTGEDALQISGWGIVGNVRLLASGRFLGVDGVIRSFEHEAFLTSNRVISTVVRQLGEGWLLNVTARIVGGTNVYGQNFGRIQVVRGVDASAIVLGTLCAGYVNSAQPIAFPGGQVRSTLDGQSVVRSVTGTNPAAGVEISETVPTGARWRLHSIRAVLVADGTVANRVASITVDDGTNELYRITSAANQTAGTTFIYMGAGIGLAALLGSVMPMSLPSIPLILVAGSRISTVTTNLQAGDNWAAPQLLIEEWIDAP